MDRQEAATELGVALGADRDTIDRAFRRRARELHPDIGGDASLLRRAIEARAVLLGMARASSATGSDLGRGGRRREPVGLQVVSVPWWARILREVRLLLPGRWRRRRRDLR